MSNLSFPEIPYRMFRAVFALVFSLVSGGLLAGGLALGVDTPSGEILTNLATEVFGILITIALVDWFLERRRRQDRARELAWNALHEIEYAVWVWQGGPRQLATDELLGLVAGANPTDAMEPFTEALVQNIGLQCRGLVQRELSVVKTLPGFRETLDDLVSLAAIGQNPPSTLVSAVSEILASSIGGLARVLGQPTARMPSSLIWYRDASPEGQEKRYLQMWPNSGRHGGPGGPRGNPA